MNGTPLKNTLHICFLAMFLLPWASLAQNPWKDVYSESAWSQRDTWQRADDIIAKLDLKPGSRVADVGCHEGYFTVKLAKKVGNDGLVYAVDLSRDKISRLQKNLSERGISNVEAIVGEEANPKLPENALDAVLIVDTYHEMDRHDEILQHISKSLKKNGRLIICEPISEERQNMSREDQERKHELGVNYAIEDVRKAGFKIVSQNLNFVDRLKEKGDTMWLIVCEKNR